MYFRLFRVALTRLICSDLRSVNRYRFNHLILSALYPESASLPVV